MNPPTVKKPFSTSLTPLDQSGGKQPSTVSRRRYERERRSREMAERLLEEKSRELWDVNQALEARKANLEAAVVERTADLEAARTAAESASAAKSAFLAMISHDIRTPLNGVTGMAQALRDTGLSREQDEIVEVILSSGDVLMALLNDVLDLSKIEARQMDLEAISFDLDALVDDVAHLFAGIAREKELRLECNKHFGSPCWVKGDPTRLRQVLHNLLSNALKFTSTGKVVLSATHEKGQLLVTVDDTGPGVRAEKQGLLFSAFSQAEASIARRHGGTGLGLAISRELCRMMEGDLSYADSPLGGARFTATARVPDAEENVRLSLANIDPAAVLTARPWRILVAEDNRTNRRVLELLLKPFQLDVKMVENGRQAVDAWSEGAFDMLLMDINMPEMSGSEATSTIRAIEKERGLAPVPIVALTANAMKHQVADYMNVGFDAHVGKPVRRNDLAASMVRLLANASVASN